MISLFPDFYKDFQCKADKCRHSCCKGWEIDIDDESARKFLSMEGKLGDDLKENINQNEDGYFFKLTKDECCPFLQENGLCRIILEAGEENICEICTMHPRFFTYVENNDVELCGVGLSCEKSAELLIENNEPLKFNIENTEMYMYFYDVLILLDLDEEDIQQNFVPMTGKENIESILEYMAETEPIDEKWTERIGYLQNNINELNKCALKYEKCYNKDVFNRIYQYIFYRQLEKISFTEVNNIMLYARMNTTYIFLEAAMGTDLLEAVRRWSEQIEYDTDNVELLLKKCE